MDKQQLTKIEAGVAACMENCRAGERPFLKLSTFIDSLKADPNWSDQEIIDLQTRVIRCCFSGPVLRRLLPKTVRG